MGTTAQKLQRVLDTKEGLKDTINTYLGQDITSAIPFKDYETYIKNFYNSLPKTDYAEGSNITLENTLKGKLDFEDGIVGYGDTSQDGTPTPETPIDIEVVRGKNRLDVTQIRTPATNVGIAVNSNGAVYDETPTGDSRSSSYANSNWQLTLPKGNWTISFIFTTQATNSNAVCHIYNSTGTLLLNGALANKNSYSGTITLTEETDIGIFSKIYDGVVYIQLEKGSTATSYLPYNTLEVVERGINLLDESTLRQGAYHSNPESKRCFFNSNYYMTPNTYTLITNLDISQYRYGIDVASNSFPLTPSTQSIDIYDSGWQTVSHKTFTLTQPGYLGVALSTLNGTGEISPSDFSSYYFMIYEGEYDSSISYEPYQTPQTYQLSLGEYEFARIPDTNYRDTIVYDIENDKVYKDKAVGKSIINGNSGTISRTATNRFNIDDFPNDYKKQANEILCLSNLYIAYAQKGTNGEFDNLVANVNYAIELSSNTSAVIHTIRIKDIRFDSIDDFKTSLNNNNLILYYALATATREEITGTLKDQIKALYNSHSFTGTTIIEIDGQLPMIIKVRALKGE